VKKNRVPRVLFCSASSDSSQGTLCAPEKARQAAEQKHWGGFQAVSRQGRCLLWQGSTGDARGWPKAWFAGAYY